MQIDIKKLLLNSVETIEIDDVVIIPKDLIKNSLIDELKNITLNGELTINEENKLLLTGILTGIMVLKDDITLEPVDYNFTADIEEILDKNKNIFYFTDVLWQNILVEIPSKVRCTNEDIELSGDGWRVISEDRFLEERTQANNPFQGLDELLNKKEEK